MVEGTLLVDRDMQIEVEVIEVVCGVGID